MSPHLNQVSLAVHGLVLAASKSKSSASSTSLLIIIGLGLLVYLFVLRPRSQRMRQQQAQKQGAGVGDEIMLTSGIIGRVTSIEGDRATVEVAPEIEIEVVRRAISQVLVKSDEEDVPMDVPPDPAADDYDLGRDGHGPPTVPGESEEESDADTTEVGTAATSPEPAAAGPVVPPDTTADQPAATGGTASAGKRRRDEPGPGAALDLGSEGLSKS